MLKTNKSLKKRIKITKKGKALARKPGHCHFNAKQKRIKQLKKKKMKSFDAKGKELKKFLPYE